MVNTISLLKANLSDSYILTCVDDPLSLATVSTFVIFPCKSLRKYLFYLITISLTEKFFNTEKNRG